MTATDALHREPRMPSLLLPREVAELLRCDLRTVRRLGERGELTKVKVGRRLVRYTPESVAALIDPENDHEPAGGELVGKVGNDDARSAP